MPSNVSAWLYICIAVAMAWVSIRLCFPSYRSIAIRSAVSWCIISGFLFLSNNAFVFLIGVAIVLLLASPTQASDRITYFCAVFLVAPIFVNVRIPFPGINYLYIIDYPTLVGLCVLLPVLINESTRHDRLRTQRRSKSLAIPIALCYLLAIGVMDFRSTSFTSGLRSVFHYTITFGIPIMALARSRLTFDQSKKVMIGFLFAGAFVLFIGMMQVVKDWAMYDQVSDELRRGEIRYAYLLGERGGDYRISSTMNPIPFGVYMAISAVIAMVSVRSGDAKKLAYLLSGLFVFGVSLSGSRGAVLCLLVSLSLLALYSEPFRRSRTFIKASLGAAMIVALMSGALMTVIESDEYGTFAYRYDLILNSMDSISRHPFFGTADFLSNETLQGSRQGQGIIDIVNSYLQVILEYGGVGLSLFVLPLVLAIRNLAHYRRQCESDSDHRHELHARLLLALLIGFAIVIGTVSMTDRMQHFYWLLICIASIMPMQDQSSSLRAKGTSRVPGQSAPQIAQR